MSYLYYIILAFSCSILFYVQFSHINVLNYFLIFRQKSQNVLKILENITKCLSYYIITNYLQFEEKKNVECISNFYQKMTRYINEDLHRCRARTVSKRFKLVLIDLIKFLVRIIFCAKIII